MVLCHYADEHCNAMIRDGYTGHISIEGKSPYQRCVHLCAWLAAVSLASERMGCAMSAAGTLRLAARTTFLKTCPDSQRSRSAPAPGELCCTLICRLRLFMFFLCSLISWLIPDFALLHLQLLQLSYAVHEMLFPDPCSCVLLCRARSWQ